MGVQVELHEEVEELACQVEVNVTSVKVHSTNVVEQEVKADKLPQSSIDQTIEVAWETQGAGVTHCNPWLIGFCNVDGTKALEDPTECGIHLSAPTWRLFQI